MIKAAIKKHIIVAVSVFIAMALTAAVFAAIITYPNAKLCFSGFTMQNGADGSIQGFVEVRVKNVEALGVQCKINYDPDYLVPSNAETNEPLDSTNTTADYFAQDIDNFPITDRGDGTVVNCFGIRENFGSIDDDNNVISLALVPEYAKISGDIQPSEYGPYIKEGPGDGEGLYIDANNSTGVVLGRLSFQIKDPARMAQLSRAELNDVFHINMLGDIAEVEIMYYDGEDEEFYSTIEYVDYDWDIETRLIDVKTAKERITVLAPQIFNAGNEQDLADYLNKNMNRLLLTYSNGDVVYDTIAWGGADFSVDKPYDPKGGTYTVSQKYNDKFTVKAEVIVKPVELIGFDVDDKSITYPNSSPPQTWGDLKMPVKATPVVSEVYDKMDIPDVALAQSDWTPDDIPSAMLTASNQMFTFTAAVPTGTLSAIPWLTVTGDYSVSVDRFIGEKTKQPYNVQASVERETGIMTILVGSLEGDAIPQNTSFKIQLPSGLLISTDDDFVTPQYNADGTASIIIDTSGSADFKAEPTQKIINLGDTNDGFSLSAKEPDKGESDFVPFSSNPRINYYTEDKVLDYTGGRRNLFSLEKGLALNDIAKHIIFADGTTIATAYHGQTGEQPSFIGEAVVKEWRIDGSSDTSLPNTAGVQVTLIGVLDDAMYTNFGFVENSDNHTITLKIVTADEEYVQNSELIRVVTNGYIEHDENNPFVFDKAREGYTSSDLQLQTFTIENIGSADIEGLNARISGTDFVLEQPPDIYLAAMTGKTDFIIRPKQGLTEGTYTATVTVGSKHTDNLKSFEIRFTVTKNELFTVNASVNDTSLGMVYLPLGTKYEQGETVQALATLYDTEYIFVRWEYSPDIGIPDDTQINITFTMPASNVDLTAILKESIISKLRLEDLQDRNPDETVNQLRDSSLAAISFDKSVEDYTVVIPYEISQNKVCFKPKYTDVDGEPITATVEFSDGTTTTVIPCTLQSDGYYHSDLFDVGVIPAVNMVTITQSAQDENGNLQSKKYTVNIIRKNEISVTMYNGNSPYGLIEDDSRWTEADKQSAKDEFDQAYRYGASYIPEGAVNTANTKYYPDAWGTNENYDKNPKALFVYEDTEFVDPGFDGLKNSDGDDVRQSDVVRRIVLQEMKLFMEPNLVTDLSTTGDYIITTSGTLDAKWKVTELKDRRIRPGIYKIEYMFTDSDGLTETFSRPLIVLSQKGDVNIDLGVDSDDSSALYNRAATSLAQSVLHGGQSWNRVYTYRVCDVNEDRNVNGVDANRVQNYANNGTGFIEFYEPLPTG